VKEIITGKFVYLLMASRVMAIDKLLQIVAFGRGAENLIKEAQ
jgi:hypothetical protein